MRPVFLFAFLVALTLLAAELSGASMQCGGGAYVPPPPPPPLPGVGDKLQNPAHGPAFSSHGSVNSNSETSGATRAESPQLPSRSLPSVPQTRSTRAGAGGLTRKHSAPSTPPITWEIWWARNRYQFFRIKDLYEIVAETTPVTPYRVGREGAMDLLSGLKADCCDTIRGYLESEHAALRRIALLALGRMKDEQAIGAMMRLLQENNKEVRDMAVIALAIHGGAEARHTLFHIALGTEEACRLMGESAVDESLRAYAIVMLAVTQTPDIVPILEGVVLDKKAPRVVRAMALEGLGLCGGEEVCPFLVDFVQNPKEEPYLLSYALTSLGKTTSPLAIPVLRKNLCSPHLAARQAAAVALGPLAAAGDEEVVKELYRCFRDSNDQALKGFSLASMGLIGGGEARQRLFQEARSGKKSEQPWACLGLGFALRDALEEAPEQYLISQAIGAGSPSMRGAAAIALGVARSRAAVPSLIRLLEQGDDPLVRGYSAQALGLIDDPSALEALRASVKNDRLPAVLSQTVLALGLMNDRESVPDLLDLLVSSPSMNVKSMISWSLMYMGEPRTVRVLLGKLQAQETDVYTSRVSVCLISRLLSSQTKRFADRLAAFSNFACEFPVVEELLSSGI